MKKIYIFLLAVFLNAFVLVGTAFADMGPKPKATGSPHTPVRGQTHSHQVNKY